MKKRAFDLPSLGRYPFNMESSTNQEVDLSLSESAIRQIRKLMARDSRPDSALRIGVTDGGCSGYSYKLDFDTEQRAEDLVLERDGVTIYIDRGSAPYLRGTVIDFVGGLYGGGFKFTNPNATATCGCGTSFSA